MKLDATLYRVVQVPLEHLWAVSGLKTGEHWSKLEPEIRKRYGMMAPRFKMFVAPIAMTEDPEDVFLTEPGNCLCGIEVMRFSVKEAHRPQAGLVTADPVSREAILMADGALGSELERIGIEIDPLQIEWRMGYVVTGN